jgi:hypothetical protein
MGSHVNTRHHKLPEHGKDRLRERSQLSEDAFLHLMDQGGRKRILFEIEVS